MKRIDSLAAHAGRLALAVSMLALLGGCAMVKVAARGSGDYIAVTRGDVLSTGKLSQSGEETLRVAGIEPKTCDRDRDRAACVHDLEAVQGIGDERRLATQSELWISRAIALTGKRPAQMSDAALQAWLDAARYAYAYLFFTDRSPGDRAFENRQTQVRDYYNYAAQQVMEALFARMRVADARAKPDFDNRIGTWRVQADMSAYRLPGGTTELKSVIAASSLRFDGLRSTYRRDGFGAELVAEVAAEAVGDPAGLALQASAPAPEQVPAHASARTQPSFSEMPYAPATVLLRFDGASLEQVLATDTVTVVPYDPYRQDEVVLHGQRVPLAGNFTAAYGLWLAQSGFASQSLRSMLGRARGIDRAHLYLMQPYDPNRRIVLMLHGLASSPEAWVNVANEIMGDESLRQHYQVWQVYYPTNAPIAFNRAEIQELIERALQHFDPQGTAVASREMVLVGHSMGGVISRLLVSSSGDSVWQSLQADHESLRQTGERGERIRRRLEPILHFAPLPQVDRAIFIAAPHRGTSIAEGRLGRLVGRLVRVPVTLMQRFGDVLQDLSGGEEGNTGGKKLLPPTSIDNLRDTDPFIRATADLPISPQVRYNTIVGQYDPKVPLIDSDDGVVPYRSAHLPGAESEKVIPSWHSVQETPQAILEIRRILHEQMRVE